MTDESILKGVEVDELASSIVGPTNQSTLPVLYQRPHELRSETNQQKGVLACHIEGWVQVDRWTAAINE